MSTYRSNLTSLHKLRTAVRDTQRERVADAIRADAALGEQTMNVRTEIDAAKAHHRAMRTGNFNVAQLLELERYELFLNAQVSSIEKQRVVVASEIERRRAELAAAEQQVRVIEKLDERRRRDFEQQQSRREQMRLDEVATQQYLRKVDFAGTKKTASRP